MLLLGDPILRIKSVCVTDVFDPVFIKESERLKQTLITFRKEKGFGRGIAAPQIGVNQRFIVLDLGKGPFILVNPEIISRSKETFMIWDDCMSFPDLLVKVSRHSSVVVRYQNAKGQALEMEAPFPGISELLQHEIDHLNGILAVDRAVDKESIVYRTVFESRKQHFLDSLNHNE